MPSIPSSTSPRLPPPLHLVSPSTLPSTSSSPFSLSILTYNVLLPNSQDGWWNYKMYNPPSTPASVVSLDLSNQRPQPPEIISEDDITSWTYRQKLLQKRIATTNPDIVCFQEVSPLSFPTDFSFMNEELGYDGSVLFRKGRFRPATFWREDRWRLVTDPVHKDRTLLTVFESVVGDGSGDGSGDDGGKTYWHVLNCHLQAGSEGKRRVRQIEEGVKTSVKVAKRLKEPDPSNPNLIICGDFNCDDTSGAIRYLEDGEIGPDFLEQDGTSVTSKPKVCPLSQPLKDAAASVTVRKPPPTLVVNELISLLVRSSSTGSNSGDDGSSGKKEEEEERHHNKGETNEVFSDDALDRLTRAYKNYATSQTTRNMEPGNYNDGDGDPTGDKVMDHNDVQRWLIDINGQVGRGSEFRSAAYEMGWAEPPSPVDETTTKTDVPSKPRIVLPSEGTLTLSGFLNVYRTELKQGKYWGIAYDLAVMGEPLPIDGDRASMFEARFDRIYYNGAKVVTTAVLDTLVSGHCPNEMEPSDHVPVAARFEVIGSGDSGDSGGDGGLQR